MTYVKHLDFLITHYSRPLLFHKYLSEEERNIVFSNIEQIRFINSEMLSQFQENCLTWAHAMEQSEMYSLSAEERQMKADLLPQLTIGKLFVLMIPYFKMYSEFCCQHSEAVHKLDELVEQRPKLKSAINQVASQDPNGLLLKDYLIM